MTLQSPLILASEDGDLEKVLELIANNEDPNPHTVKFNVIVLRLVLKYVCIHLFKDSTPLKEACSGGYLDIASALLRAGADPNLVTDVSYNLVIHTGNQVGIYIPSVKINH